MEECDDENEGRKGRKEVRWGHLIAFLKVKDDANLLKRSLKRVEKKKEKSKTKWAQRTEQLQEKMKAKQDKRKANLKVNSKQAPVHHFYDRTDKGLN